MDRSAGTLICGGSLDSHWTPLSISIVSCTVAVNSKKEKATLLGPSTEKRSSESLNSGSRVTAVSQASWR